MNEASESIRSYITSRISSGYQSHLMKAMLTVFTPNKQDRFDQYIISNISLVQFNRNLDDMIAAQTKELMENGRD